MKWNPYPETKPPKTGLYLVCCPTADPKFDLMHVIQWNDRERKWLGLNVYWTPAIRFWARIPRPRRKREKDRDRHREGKIRG